MKTEKRKMLAGELYFASDEELVTERQKARRLTSLFNATTETELVPDNVVVGGNPARVIKSIDC